MPLRAEVMNAAPEQAKLHAKLDDQAQVVVGERLEGDDELFHVAAPAVRVGIGQRPEPLVGQVLAPTKDLLPVGLGAQAVLVLEHRILKQGADVLAQLRVGAVEEAPHGVRVEGRLRLHGRRLGPLPEEIAHDLLPVNVEGRLDVFQRPTGGLRQRRAVAAHVREGHSEFREGGPGRHCRVSGPVPQRANPPEVLCGRGGRLGIEVVANRLTGGGIEPLLRAKVAPDRLRLRRREHPVGPGHVQQWKDGADPWRVGIEHGSRVDA